jgi:Phage integrase, N-terminal SAM-like domain
VRHLKGTNRAVNTQRIYRRAALGLVTYLEQDGNLPGPRQLTRRHIEAYMAHLIDTRSASTANVVHRGAGQVIAALAFTSWPAHLTDVVARTGIAPDIALSEVFDAAWARAEDAQLQPRAVTVDRLPERATDAAMETSARSSAPAASGGRTFRLQLRRRHANGGDCASVGRRLAALTPLRTRAPSLTLLLGHGPAALRGTSGRLFGPKRLV